MNNKLHRSAIAGAIALSLLFCLAPLAAAETVLQVKCVDSAGAAVEGAKVYALNLKTQKSKDKKSDRQGTAELKLDDGTYRFFARKEGFAPALYEFVTLPGSETTVTLKMAAGEDAKLYFEDPAEEKRAHALLGQALDLYKQSKFADAEGMLRQSLEVNPSNAEAAYYLGVSLLQQEKFDEAQGALENAEKLAKIFAGVSEGDQTVKVYNQIIGSVAQLRIKLPAIRGESANKKRNYELAIKEFSEAIRLDPNSPDNHANLAIALANAQKFDEALSSMDKAIQMKPGESQYEQLKKTIQAKREAADIERAKASLDEGNKLLESDAAAALQKFEEAYKAVPQNQQYVIVRQIARAYAKLNQQEKAVESFRKSIELAPEDKIAEYRNSFAQYYLDVKKFDEALDVLADPKNSADPEAELITLARNAKDKQPVLAEAALERVLKSNPGNIDVYYELGQLYYMDGKEKDARTKELLTKYVESGKDESKLENAKSMLIIINRRSK
ncbi:MAG: tetratricopeptide repeat protein [Acidobacteria bacterium]|nr:tetratricopeptide repeat protein [Acidobacteriota bacterium]